MAEKKDKDQETFRVVDRRLFTPEGELRKEALEQERAQSESEAQPGRKPSAPPAARADKQSGTAAAPSTPDAQPTPQPSRAFELLIDFLGRNAAVLLGGYADPQTGQAILDLEGARELIDMLDALREKTQGNLAPEEDQLLIEVLGSLKLNYMEMSKAAAKAMHEKAGGKS